MTTSDVFLLLVLIVNVAGWVAVLRSLRERRARDRDPDRVGEISYLDTELMSPIGVRYYVKLMCAECHRVNRVPHDKVGKKPVCGHCKQRLMPLKGAAISFVTSVVRDDHDPVFSREMHQARGNYDEVWSAIERMVRRDAGIKVPAIPTAN